MKDIRILIVDDNESARYTAQKLFEKAAESLPFRVEVETVTSAAAAVKKVRDTVYDVILMDLMMPDVDGYEAVRRMRKLPRGKTPVIYAFSAFDGPDVREKAYAAGMTGTLDKLLSLPVVRYVLEHA